MGRKCDRTKIENNIKSSKYNTSMETYLKVITRSSSQGQYPELTVNGNKSLDHLAGKMNSDINN